MAGASECFNCHRATCFSEADLGHDPDSFSFDVRERESLSFVVGGALSEGIPDQRRGGVYYLQAAN